MNIKLWRALACLLAMCSLAAVPVSNASASARSIKAVFKAYLPKIEVAEGKVESAFGEFEKTKDVTVVQGALANSVDVLKALDAKLAAQPAGKPKVKKAKAKLVDGVKAIIVAYDRLSKAMGDTEGNLSAAKMQLKRALSAIKVGKRQLEEGLKLLGAK